MLCFAKEYPIHTGKEWFICTRPARHAVARLASCDARRPSNVLFPHNSNNRTKKDLRLPPGKAPRENYTATIILQRHSNAILLLSYDGGILDHPFAAEGEIEHKTRTLGITTIHANGI